ncbi:MAG TPA: helicase C-terminal domain-containing protein [Candidatus Limnocylindrales bacterium]|nr:helicase C-terminal domain-containing protein [Candidatus Limnocylindrales bacterium]
MNETFVALDLETTGLAPRIDRIIEVGAVRFRDDEVIARYESLVRPEVPIPPAVQQLTGITDRDVAHAPSPEQALAELIDFVGDSPVVAHSGSFDLSFLGEGRNGQGYRLYDTLDLARILLPMAPSHSLPHLARELDLHHPNPHRALPDADAARQLFRYLSEFTRGLPQDLLDRMLEVTRGWDDPLRDILAWASQKGPNGTRSLMEPPASISAAPRRAKPSTDPQAIRSLLGPDGPMARELDAYELRESQLQMTLAVAQLFARGGRLMVEAGPGTGKSLAYLVPAVHHAVARQERIVVATNTITLQEQLYHKDIPFLRSWLPFDFTASLLKGRANYVSLRRWNRYLNAPSRRVDGSWFPEEVAFKLRMLVWLAQSAHGDRSEIRLNGLEDVFWLRAASTPDDCLASHCPNYRAQRCFYWNSRRAAQDADVIVTNHALLLADALGNGGVLPAYEHVVVDEAHQLEETAVESLTVRVGEEELLESLDGTLTWFRAACGPPDEAVRAAADEMRRVAVEIFTVLRGALRALALAEPGPGQRPREGRILLDRDGLRDAELGALAAPAGRLAASVAALRVCLDGALAGLTVEPNPHAVRELDLFLTQLESRTGTVDEALVRPRPSRLYWAVTERRSGRPLIQAAPTQAGHILQERALRGKKTVVFTSATLAVADSFAYFRRGVGLDGDAHEMILSSPFDYLAQALLCLPTDLFELQDPRFLDQAAETIGAIGRTLGGRTLVLFTAHQQMRDVAERLSRLIGGELPVLAQNIDGTRRQLLARFQEDPRAVLLGTSSFWEGIDVPGDALSCVVIVRLPFRVPTDPIQVARGALLRDPFAELTLPEAVLRLKQGFGRLIRRRSDRGAVVLLDHRIANRTYGQAFLDALPRAAIHLGSSDEIAPAIGQWLTRPPRVRAPFNALA